MTTPTECVSWSLRFAKWKPAASHRHRAVGRDELLVEVWGYRDGSVQTRTVDVHIAQLRGKLKALPDGDRIIETIRGRGYQLGVEIA